ncbi:MAG: hypothetical protein ACFFHD_05990 [Promethearchaeota archaeon]
MEQEVRIPLSPIRIKTHILYHFFELLYPKFLSDQNNILDLIVSDDGRELLNLFFYKTSKAGIHDSIEKLPLKIVKYKHRHFDEFGRIFNRIQDDLLKKKNVRISSIRLFKASGIDILNKYCENIEDISINDFILKFLELIQQLFEKDLFFIYPKPTLYKSLKEFFSFLNTFQIKNIVGMIYDILPEFDKSFFITSERINLIFHLQNHQSNSARSQINFRVLLPIDLGINENELSEKKTLKFIQEKLNTESIYSISQHIIISLLSDLIELTVPLKKENLQFLMQKILFGFRSFEKFWDMRPKPIVYNMLVRFILRFFGLILNLRKLSHWTIPNLLFNLLDSNFGLNSRVLIILTNVEKYKKINSKKIDYLKTVTENGILLEIEDSTLVKILSLKKEIIFSEGIHNSLELIKAKVSEEFGFISAIIILDKLLIGDVLNNFVIEHTKLTSILKLKTLKMLKKKEYFYIYPELPIYKLIKRRGILSLLKLLLPIVIDKHEF